MSEIRVLADCVSGEGLLDLQTAVFLYPHMVEGGRERERERDPFSSYKHANFIMGMKFPRVLI